MIQQINNRAQESKGFICEFIVYASYSFGKHIPDPPIKETSMFERKMIVPSRNKKRQERRIQKAVGKDKILMSY